MRPFEPAGSGGATTAALPAIGFAALSGLAMLASLVDFAVLRAEGKEKF